MSEIKVNSVVNSTGDNDSGLDLSTNDKIGIKIANAEVATVDTSGVVFNDASADRDFRVESNGNANMLFVDGGNDRVGIGQSAPTGLLGIVATNSAIPSIRIESPTSDSDISISTYNDSNGTYAMFGANTLLDASGNTAVLDTNKDSAAVFIDGRATGNIAFHTGATGVPPERARITNDGSLFYGTTSNVGTNDLGVAIDAGDNFMIRHGLNSTATQDRVRFYNANGLIGKIQTTGSATAYVTSSDYRLKENITYDFDATTRLKQLKPCRFNFIADSNTTVDGFIAHEVTAVPEAVSGEKDAMTAEVLYVDGDEIPEGKKVGDVKVASKIDPQGIDQSKLVPLLVKTIQELEARITALENA
tara:strand:- start:4 stop:1086 length:1083 start_codon:yes stop_codon:yes gene_type:complete